jgi:hypothetical protein
MRQRFSPVALPPRTQVDAQSAVPEGTQQMPVAQLVAALETVPLSIAQSAWSLQVAGAVQVGVARQQTSPDAVQVPSTVSPLSIPQDSAGLHAAGAAQAFL